MNDQYFPAVRRWILPEAALRDSLLEMARDGAHRHEGCALWLGRRQDGVADITHLIGLRGPGIVKRPDYLNIERWLFNEVADAAIALGLSVVGQIHSHGPGYGTNLSPVDRTGGIAIPYYLSVVAPDYALRPNTGLTDCGVHVFEPKHGYRRLGPEEILTRLCLSSGPQVPMTLVGKDRP
jgi:proteasome lid subunit RPN8/RPN11